MTQMSPTSKPKVKTGFRNGRKRFLNIIYFFDSNQTHTLKFSIKTSYFTVGILALMITWSFFASLLLIREYNLNSELKRRSRTLLSLIFSYQTRYDQIYEKIYPSEDSPLIAVKTEQESENSFERPLVKDFEDEKKPKLEALIESGARPKVVQNLPSSPTVPSLNTAPTIRLAARDSLKMQEETATAPNPSNRLEPPVTIENFSSVTRNEVVTARFALKNTDQGSKARGTVSAMAHFFEEGKEPTWLKTQFETDGDQADTNFQDDPHSDQHFNIRFYKNKIFHFSKPNEKSGFFSEVRIIVKDEKGRSKEFMYPINKDLQIKQSKLENSSARSDENTAERPTTN